MDNDFSFFYIPGTHVQAAITEVEDTSTVFDTHDERTLRRRPVPGYGSAMYIPWGDDDRLPYKIIDLVGGDEVTSQNKLFNVQTCYGAGLELQDAATRKPTTDKEVKDWARRQSLPSYLLEQMTDMKHFYFSVAVIILSKDGRRINRIAHKDACYCRLAETDKRGKIPYVYYANWRNGRPQKGEVERIPLLDIHDPWGDLCALMGREPGADGHTFERTKARKFALLMRFPTAGCSYYPVPYWASIFRGGSYDEKRLISVGKRAKLRNATGVKYQVEVERDYWQRICDSESIYGKEERKKRIKRERENIRDFISGIENQGKVWISGYYINPDGHEVRDVRINNIAAGKAEGGDWMEDVQAASNTISFADGVHSNLVGTVPGKAQTNNSGSDKRELFTMKQALEVSWHDILLMPLRLVCWYNGWDTVEPVIPMIQLTTLDEHRDSKKVNPAQSNGNDNND